MNAAYSDCFSRYSRLGFSSSVWLSTTAKAAEIKLVCRRSFWVAIDAIISDFEKSTSAHVLRLRVLWQTAFKRVKRPILSAQSQ